MFHHDIQHPRFAHVEYVVVQSQVPQAIWEIRPGDLDRYATAKL